MKLRKIPLDDVIGKGLLMTPENVADYLNVSISSVKHWVCENKLTYTKVNGMIRFRKEWIDDFVDKSMVVARGAK